MSDVERLYDYYQFSETVMAGVEAAHKQHAGASFSELADRYGVSEGPTVVSGGSYGKPFEVFTLKPKGDYDEHSARVWYAQMACPADESTTMQAMHVFAADPTEQMIVVGNPGIVGRGAGRLSLRGAYEVAKGDSNPTVDPVLYHLKESGIAKSRHIGGSYGASRAVVASGRAKQEFDLDVSHVVAIDPVNTSKRSLSQLGKVFLSTSADNKLDDAVRRSGIAAYVEAQQLADKGLARYVAGLALRPSNIAIARSLARPSFAATAANAMRLQPHMKIAAFAGGKSEFNNATALFGIQARLDGYPDYVGRFSAAVVKGMYHADINDLDLQAALVHTGLGMTAIEA